MHKRIFQQNSITYNFWDYIPKGHMKEHMEENMEEDMEDMTMN